MSYKLFKPMAPPQRGVIPFALIVQRMKSRIEAGGYISTKDAWEALRYDFAYQIIALYFKVLMEQLIARKLAAREKMGQYTLVDNIVIDDKALVKEAGLEKEKPKKWRGIVTPVKIPDLPASQDGLTKYSAQDDGIRRVGPFYSKVYGTFINL